MIISQKQCGAGSPLIQDATCHVNLCPIQLILRRLHFLVGSDEVPVERANSESSWDVTCCPSSWGGTCCCFCCCHIMNTRDSLVVISLSPDESEENNTCHVSRVLSPALFLLWFCFGFSCFKPVKWLPWRIVVSLSWMRRPSGVNALLCAIHTQLHFNYSLLCDVNWETMCFFVLPWQCKSPTGLLRLNC